MVDKAQTDVDNIIRDIVRDIKEMGQRTTNSGC
jgi:hypothetical protein